jgi:hypothetical protein
MEEAVLQQLFDELGRGIAVPDDGADRVVALLSTSGSTRRPSPRATRLLMVAAVLAVVAGIAVLMHGSTSHDTASRVAGRTLLPRGLTASTPPGQTLNQLPTDAPVRSGRDYQSHRGRAATTPATTVPGATNPLTDDAKIVKTGTLDLQVPKHALKPTVNRVTGVAVGLGGYVSDSKTDYQSDSATAEITIRVPVANFETATSRIDGLPGVDVLGDSENGTDVTGQYTDLQGQLTAATTERDSLLTALADANTVGDILAVHDRIAAVNTQIDQLQGQINLLNNRASLSSIAVTITEKTAQKTAAAAPPKPPTGLSKAWRDARQGFSNSIEWLIARSGGALIVLLAALALVFGTRYLYPVLRRALL